MALGGTAGDVPAARRRRRRWCRVCPRSGRRPSPPGSDAGGARARSNGRAPCCGCRPPSTSCRVALEAAARGRRVDRVPVGGDGRRGDRPGCGASRCGWRRSPRDWAMAAAGGCVVVGARAAAFAPDADAGVVRRDRRARRGAADTRGRRRGTPATWCWSGRGALGVPAVLTSPCPSLESVARSPLVTLDRGPRTIRLAAGRGDRPPRRRQRPDRPVLGSARSARCAATGRVVCVLNRTGRARLLACRTCETLARVRGVRRGRVPARRRGSWRALGAARRGRWCARTAGGRC